MLMLLSVHVTSILFLVWFNNSALTMELHAFTVVARSYVLLAIANYVTYSYNFSNVLSLFGALLTSYVCLTW